MRRGATRVKAQHRFLLLACLLLVLLVVIVGGREGMLGGAVVELPSHLVRGTIAEGVRAIVYCLEGSGTRSGAGVEECSVDNEQAAPVSGE